MDGADARAWPAAAAVLEGRPVGSGSPSSGEGGGPAEQVQGSLQPDGSADLRQREGAAVNRQRVASGACGGDW